MFQFPGFASKPLCIQDLDTCFDPLLISEDNNNEPSGGFPHSDIHGSKPIPGSPWLNAGYHVLHRLLLPRHPPNALFALDLIQKEQGTDCRCSQAQVFRLRPPWRSRVSKAVLTHAAGWFAQLRLLVSVLDLEQYRSWDQTQLIPTRISQTILMFLSLNDVKSRPVGRPSACTMRLTVKPSCHTPPVAGLGGAYRDRTDDLLNANQALSQLS